MYMCDGRGTYHISELLLCVHKHHSRGGHDIHFLSEHHSRRDSDIYNI